MKNYLFLLLLIPLISCSQNKNHSFKVVKSNDEWKKTLTNKEYKILRKAGTERAFTGKYN